MHITESELIILQRADAIRSVHIKGTDAGFCVNFAVGAQTAILMTSRNEVRYWGQLNCLANWLKQRDLPHAQLDICSWNAEAAAARHLKNPNA